MNCSDIFPQNTQSIQSPQRRELGGETKAQDVGKTRTRPARSAIRDGQNTITQQTGPLTSHVIQRVAASTKTKIKTSTPPHHALLNNNSLRVCHPGLARRCQRQCACRKWFVEIHDEHLHICIKFLIDKFDKISAWSA